MKKVISITIAYFDLGQGTDYVYRGTTTFHGIHKKDILTLSEKQIELYKKQSVHEIYPEYWLIKVGKFANTINDKLDEWIYFFKNAEIKNNFSAKGLKAAGERLTEMKLNEEDQKDYKRYLKHLHDIASDNYTKMIDAQDLINQGVDKGRAERDIEIVIRLHKKGRNPEEISDLADLPIEQVVQIIRNLANK